MPQDDKFPQKHLNFFGYDVDPQMAMTAAALAGLTGLGVHEYAKYRDYRSKFNKKNPSYA